MENTYRFHRSDGIFGGKNDSFFLAMLQNLMQQITVRNGIMQNIQINEFLTSTEFKNLQYGALVCEDNREQYNLFLKCIS
jgi:hypothetical protein